MQSCLSGGMLLYIIVLSGTIFYAESAQSTSCSYKDKTLRYKACEPIAKVHWYELPPYIYQNKTTGAVVGVLKDIIEQLIKTCCGQCVDFEYLPPNNNSKGVETSIGQNDSGLNFPIYGKIITNKFNEFPYLPVIEAPGIIYVTKRPPVGQASKMLMTSVTQAWPILVVIFFMSAVTGIITWATDSYINPDQFPSPFFLGAWDGFWWALVSMTTVGYGDKAPRGYTARSIAFVWILIGLCLYAIFSGFISTSSTAGAIGGDIDIFGKKLVTLNQSVEQRFGIQSNAKITAVRTMEEYFQKIVSDEVAGGLIDSYFAGFYEKELADNGIIVNGVLDHQVAYGFALSNNFTAPKIQKCLWRTLSVSQQFINALIEKNMNAVPELSEAELAAMSTALFDYRSPIFQTTMRDCGIILGVLMLLGFAWDYGYKRPRDKKEQKEKDAKRKVSDSNSIKKPLPYRSMEELLSAQNAELEEAMKMEVKAFLTAFNRRDNDYNTLITNPSFKKMLPELFEDADYHFVSYD